jgi:hypothetical protein
MKVLRAAPLLALVALAASLAPGAPARADCSGFKWSLAREQAWFRDPHPTIASGGALAVGGAATLQLQPIDNISFAVAPERKPADGTFGGVATIAALKAATYQVTLSEDAWIDVVQAGRATKSLDFSGQKDCPGIHKSVRFTLSDGPAIIEISGAKTRTIDLATGNAP